MDKFSHQVIATGLIALLAFLVCGCLGLLSIAAGIPLAINVFGYGALTAFGVFVVCAAIFVIITIAQGE